MARYIDADKIHEFVDAKVAEGKDGWANGVPYEWAYALTVIDNQPTADVVPKAEMEKWRQRAGVRARDLDDLQKERDSLAREIFEEIGRVVCHEYNIAQVNAYNYHIYGDNDEMVGWEKVSYLQGIKRIIKLLKDIEKKYTEDN